MFAKTDVYQYWVPVINEPRFVDPLALRRNLLLATHGRAWAWAKEARGLDLIIENAEAGVGEAEDPVVAEAQKAEFSKKQAELEGFLVAGAYKAFGLPPIDPMNGQGITETCALELLYDFMDWLEKKEEQPSGSPT